MKSKEEINESNRLLTLLKSDLSERMVHLSDVFYIQVVNGKKRKLTFHLEKETIETEGSIGEWQEKLADSGFIMCNRSILVNLEHVYIVNERFVRLTNEVELPISRRQFQDIKMKFVNSLIRLKR